MQRVHGLRFGGATHALDWSGGREEAKLRAVRRLRRTGQKLLYLALLDNDMRLAPSHHDLGVVLWLLESAATRPNVDPLECGRYGMEVVAGICKEYTAVFVFCSCMSSTSRRKSKRQEEKTAVLMSRT